MLPWIFSELSSPFSLPQSAEDFLSHIPGRARSDSPRGCPFPFSSTKETSFWKSNGMCHLHELQHPSCSHPTVFQRYQTHHNYSFCSLQTASSPQLLCCYLWMFNWLRKQLKSSSKMWFLQWKRCGFTFWSFISGQSFPFTLLCFSRRGCCPVSASIGRPRKEYSIQTSSQALAAGTAALQSTQEFKEMTATQLLSSREAAEIICMQWAGSLCQLQIPAS